MDFQDDLPPEAVEEIASLLAKGCLRYWKSLRRRATPELDLQAAESRHVTVVDAQERGEK